MDRTPSITKNQHLLVDLEMLLDTRFGLLASSFESQFSTLDLAAYQARNINAPYEHLEGVSEQQWNEAWASRDKAAIKAAVPTEFLLMFYEMCLGLVQQAVSTPLIDSVSVDVNIYPYRFNGAEANALIESVGEYAGNGVSVSVVRLAPEGITPALLKSKYVAYAAYDFDGWMSENMDALTKTPIPDITLIAPRYYRERVPTIEEITHGKDKLVCPPEDLIYYALIEHISVSFLPPKLASVMEFK